MSQSRTRTTQPSNLADITANLTAFLKDAWTRYDSNAEGLAGWARTNARAYYHTLPVPIPFLTIYNAFITYAKARKLSDTEAPAVRRRSTFAEDGKQTDAEFNHGKNEMNSLLHREYSLWWDAFVAEAQEDTEVPLTAEQRFADHCAKKLATKTGLSRTSLATVVRAWLQLHA